MNASRWLMLLFCGVVVSAGCTNPGPEALTEPKREVPDHSSVAVVGVKGPVRLASDEASAGAEGTLEEGTQVSVVEVMDLSLRIRTASGQLGTVPRHLMCSQPEYERRRTGGLVPQNVICIANGGVLYGGSLSIQNGRPTALPGDAFWLDTTMQGQEFTIGSQKVVGDPAVLLLMMEGGKLERLQVYPEAGSRNK